MIDHNLWLCSRVANITPMLVVIVTSIVKVATATTNLLKSNATSNSAHIHTVIIAALATNITLYMAMEAMLSPLSLSLCVVTIIGASISRGSATSTISRTMLIAPAICQNIARIRSEYATTNIAPRSVMML